MGTCCCLLETESAKLVSSFLLRLVKKDKKMEFGFSIFQNTVTEIFTRDCHSKM